MHDEELRLNLSKYHDESVFKYYKCIQFNATNITDEKVSHVKNPYNITIA